jgi:uncharacterized BrkB/YihY/UPF0761 family membrane protein
MIVVLLLLAISFACVNCIVLPKAEIDHSIRLRCFYLVMISVVWLACLHLMIFSNKPEDEIGAPIGFTVTTALFLFTSYNLASLIKKKREYQAINTS